MEFFEAVSRRRSVRTYSSKPVPDEVVNQALDAALLAPNSSNMQTWRMYWVRTPEKREQLVQACLNQGAARTAQELVVVAADGSAWRESHRYILESIKDNPRKDLHDYYGKLIPFMYGYQWLAPLKWIGFHIAGLFRPMYRYQSREMIAVKSAALACENFMLAIAAQGFDTCPMEGFDAVRVRRLLGLRCSTAIVMVISIGERTERGIWGERFRIPRDVVVSEV